ncbi:unnamed protein product [Calicophoron daubneyi]|uniref:histone acetyltransferase n=1 Tax=Calicophoron daubneyi TaxID=300641 RepID=A0AAV2T8G6_CALDB
MDVLGGSSLEDYRVAANEAVSFKLVKHKADFQDGTEFHPEYTHQIFGESEQIFGYKDLKVNIWYIAGSLSTYIGISYTSCINEKDAKGVKPDDIMKILSEIYPYKVERNLVDFARTFHDEKFKPIGVPRHSYQCCDNAASKYCIYYMEYGMPDFDEFLQYHKKMESFILFFVDGASPISTDDSQWCYYTIFEVSDGDGPEPQYAFIGYMTVYKFYAYPSSLRPRISQFLILPPYRMKGHGSELLTTFYRDFIHVPNVRDITVEDPSPEFRRLRDFVDCKRCLEQPEIMKCFSGDDAVESNLDRKHPDFVAFRNKARDLLKMNRCQAKRIFEALQLYLLPRTPKAQAAFRAALYKRVVACYERTRTDAMCGRSIDPRVPQSSTGALQKVFGEVADECYKSQVNERVDFEMDAFQAIVSKLDRCINSSKTTQCVM